MEIAKFTTLPTIEQEFELLKLKVNHKVRIIDVAKTEKFFFVDKVSPVYLMDKKLTPDQIPTEVGKAGEKALKTLNDWLKPGNDELFVFLFGILSDRLVEVRVYLPAATQIFGIDSDDDAVITNDISDYYNPKVVLKSWETIQPNFKLRATNYIPKIVRFGIRGVRYLIRETDDKTPPFATADFSVFGGGGR